MYYIKWCVINCAKYATNVMHMVSVYYYIHNAMHYMHYTMHYLHYTIHYIHSAIQCLHIPGNWSSGSKQSLSDSYASLTSTFDDLSDHFYSPELDEKLLMEVSC